MVDAGEAWVECRQDAVILLTHLAVHCAAQPKQAIHDVLELVGREILQDCKRGGCKMKVSAKEAGK